MVVAADDVNVYVLTSDGLFRLGAGQRLEKVAEVGGHVFWPITAAAGAVYLVDEAANQVYLTHPAPPSASTPQTGSMPRWPFLVAGVAVLLVGASVLVVRRRRRTR